MNTEELILNHRSVRRFEGRPVAPEVLDRILECGMRAPNTGNMQMYSIVVTEEAARREALGHLHFDQCATAPVLLTVCVDIYRYHHWCRLRGCDEPYTNLLWFLTGTVDASLVAQNINNAAESEGLGCCFLGTVLYNTRAIAEQLDLPQGVVPVVTIALGYPAEEPAQSERLPASGVVHRERYCHYTDEEIDRIHREREEFPFNQEMVRLNGTRNLAELFTAKRYPRAANEATSEALRALLQEQGLL